MYGRGRRENEVKLGEEEELARVAGEEQRHERAKKDIKLKYAILCQQTLLSQILRRVAPGLEALSYLEYKEPPWDGWPVRGDSNAPRHRPATSLPQFERAHHLHSSWDDRDVSSFVTFLIHSRSRRSLICIFYILSSLPSLDDFSRPFPNLTAYPAHRIQQHIPAPQRASTRLCPSRCRGNS